MKLTFFRSPSHMRAWFEKHHTHSQELWVGYYKTSSGRVSITWPESVEEALCFGWIDGVRKGIDETSYTIRFSPRKSTSIWSVVNIRHARALIERGLMQPAGLQAFQLRKEKKSGIYSYEQMRDTLPEPYARELMKNKTAWVYFQTQAPSYRKAAIWWIVSAKMEKTRLSHLERLIEDSAHGRRIQHLTSKKS